jgi:phage gp45-like
MTFMMVVNSGLPSAESALYGAKGARVELNANRKIKVKEPWGQVLVAAWQCRAI